MAEFCIYGMEQGKNMVQSLLDPEYMTFIQKWPYQIHNMKIWLFLANFCKKMADFLLLGSKNG